MFKKCLWSDLEMIFVTRCLLDVEFRLLTDIHQMSMSKQYLWSNVEMTFAIRCSLDVKFKL